MSFIDMNANDVWSEQDIVNRTEEIKRNKYSDQEELILNRKVSGMQLGMYTLTASEQAELMDFNATVVQARAAGDAARTDMAALNLAFSVEAAQAALAAIPADGVINPDDDPVVQAAMQQSNTDLAAQRATQQAIIDGASADTTALVASRAAYRASLLPPPPPDQGSDTTQTP